MRIPRHLICHKFRNRLRVEIKGDLTPDLVNAMRDGINDHAVLQRDSFRRTPISVEESAERMVRAARNESWLDAIDELFDDTSIDRASLPLGEASCGPGRARIG